MRGGRRGVDEAWRRESTRRDTASTADPPSPSLPLPRAPLSAPRADLYFPHTPPALETIHRFRHVRHHQSRLSPIARAARDPPAHPRTLPAPASTPYRHRNPPPHFDDVRVPLRPGWTPADPYRPPHMRRGTPRCQRAAAATHSTPRHLPRPRARPRPERRSWTPRSPTDCTHAPRSNRGGARGNTGRSRHFNRPRPYLHFNLFDSKIRWTVSARLA